AALRLLTARRATRFHVSQNGKVVSHDVALEAPAQVTHVDRGPIRLMIDSREADLAASEGIEIRQHGEARTESEALRKSQMQEGALRILRHDLDRDFVVPG